ncbi:MAG: helix-turn-helix domain-containing protein [Gammaproteobacteria bacterium]|nr:helix-turn-helix domain-containing protein [Gammaproteobacteria bacterium]
MHAAKFVDSYFDAWNHHDAQSVADHLTKDGIYHDLPENVQRTKQQLITNLNGFFSNYRHRYELTGEMLSSDETIAFQYRMISPDGNGDDEILYNGAEFMTLRGDAAISIVDYYDIPGITRPAELAQATSHDNVQPKYAKSGLDDDHLAAYKQRLDHIMQAEQFFLEPNLTLPRLADTVGCSVNHLSQVINSGFGMSFFDYINQYRVGHAQALLTELNGQKGAVLNIAFTVGFNSNSAFYAAFKKHVGQTPAQYRRSRAAS